MMQKIFNIDEGLVKVVEELTSAHMAIVFGTAAGLRRMVPSFAALFNILGQHHVKNLHV